MSVNDHLGGGQSPTFHIMKSDQTWIDEALEEVFKQWREVFVDEYENFKIGAEMEKGRYDFRGLYTGLPYSSKEKITEVVGFTPPHLQGIMDEMFGQDWNFNQKIANRFWYHFDMGRIRREKPGRPGPNENRIVTYES